MQIIFQDPFGSLNPRFLVKDIIAEPIRVHLRASAKEVDKRVVELMELVGLDASRRNRYPHEFSGGQRQRIGIARAIALNPKFIVADEAVSALDVSVQSQVLNLLVKLQKELGLTYLFIAHGLNVVRHISDRVGVMYLGKLVEVANTEALFSAPRHPYTAALLSAIPRATPHKKQERIILQGDVPSPANPPIGCRFHPRCPSAGDKCRREEPQLLPLSEGRDVACHYPLE
jgi:peptide/nickel transport system ATP-binding protein